MRFLSTLMSGYMAVFTARTIFSVSKPVRSAIMGAGCPEACILAICSRVFPGFVSAASFTAFRYATAFCGSCSSSVGVFRGFSLFSMTQIVPYMVLVEQIFPCLD